MSIRRISYLFRKILHSISGLYCANPREVKPYQENEMDTKDASNIGKNSRVTLSRLKQEREQRGWTQSELAGRIGTTQVNVSRWEKSITVPGPYYRQKLAETFAKSIKELGFISQSDEELHEEITVLSDIPSTPSSPIWNIPQRRNPFFTGREKILHICIQYLEVVM